MNCCPQLAVSNLLVHPLRRSKFARAMHPVADPDGCGVPDAGKTSRYATAHRQIYQFDDIRYPSPSGLDPSFFLRALKQST